MLIRNVTSRAFKPYGRVIKGYYLKADDIGLKLCKKDAFTIVIR